MHTNGNLYADLAGYYDRFCAEVDYIEQCEFARRAFRAFTQTAGVDYLDVACGTGQHMQVMQQHGFTASGLDNSEAMLKQAAVRCPDATLYLSDMAALDQHAQFDLLTCFLYSLHYCHPTSAVAETLRRSFAALKPGGVLIFNAVDARGIQNDEGVTTYLDDGADKLSFKSGWHYRGDGDVLDLNLTITRTAAGSEQQWRDHHTMTALTFPQIEALLQSVGFEVSIMEHDYSVMQHWNGASSNAIFVACKPL